jgi:hypothetical protein
MKTKLTFFLAALLLLPGCDWFKDLADVKFSTDLVMDIPVTASTTKSYTPEISVYSFSVAQDLELGDNTDIEPYLAKIKNIDLKSLVVTVNGLSAGQTINTISLSVTGVGTICTQTNITSTSNSFTPAISSELLDQAAAKLKADKKITVTVAGNTNVPATFITGLVFDAEITAGALD